jgi:hypothetical protein
VRAFDDEPTDGVVDTLSSARERLRTAARGSAPQSGLSLFVAVCTISRRKARKPARALMSSHVQRLLRPGTAVRLYREPKTDAVDAYGRLLRYVFRVRDGLNVNVRLVRVGEAAPYFYDHRRGRYAQPLLRLFRRARARRLGLWGHSPGTPWDPDHGVSTGPA